MINDNTSLASQLQSFNESATRIKRLFTRLSYFPFQSHPQRDQEVSRDQPNFIINFKQDSPVLLLVESTPPPPRGSTLRHMWTSLDCPALSRYEPRYANRSEYSRGLKNLWPPNDICTNTTIICNIVTRRTPPTIQHNLAHYRRRLRRW